MVIKEGVVVSIGVGAVTKPSEEFDSFSLFPPFRARGTKNDSKFIFSFSLPSEIAKNKLPQLNMKKM
ncbi:MAG: hypothetical protein KDK90_21480 [Leptospiraceae bacterium]|nr:hypothetical protein [Leptospiraceae bacterium]